MNAVMLDLGIAGTALRVHGPEVWLMPLCSAWATWQSVPKTVPWDVELTADASLPVPQAPLFEAIPHSRGGICTLAAPGFEGEVSTATGAAHLRAHPEAEPADIGYFLRVALAVQAFARGGMLFHTAGIVHRGQGYALFGVSGSGKTTAAHFSTPDPVLNDDLVLLWPSMAGWQMYATPFGKRRGAVRVAPLRALLRLVKDTNVSLMPLSPGRALGELVANTPVLSADSLWLPEVLARWEALLNAIPVYTLHFRRDATFWEVIDAELG